MSSGGLSETYRELAELGHRSQRVYASIKGESGAVVTTTFDGERIGPGPLAVLLRDARCLAKNWHPNVARIRDVALASSLLTVATDLIEGVTLEDLIALSKHGVSPAILTRIALDVLAGLGALHGLREGLSAPLSTFHGELCPANVVVGRDGVARIVHVLRVRPVTVMIGSEALGYAAPEALACEGDQDLRADLYAVGVILWEGLTRRRLYIDPLPGRIAQAQREEDISLPEGDPRLVAVVMRALSFDPANRFRGAPEMASAIRAATTVVAPGSGVAQLVGELAGDRIRARRATLDAIARGRSAPAQPSPPSTRPFHDPAPSTRPVLAADSAPSLASKDVIPDADRDDEHDGDYPGPRPSMGDEDYLAQLWADALESAGGREGPESLGEALAAAHEVVVSSASIEPPREPLSEPELPSLFPSVDALTPPIAGIALPSPPEVRVAPDPVQTPSTRTPFVLDVVPVTARRAQLTLPLVGLAAITLVLLITSVTWIAHRRNNATTPEKQNFPPPPALSVLPTAAPKLR